LSETVYPCACGAIDAEPVLDHAGDGLWHAVVECSDCDRVGPHAQSPDPDIAEARAREAWNQRAPVETEIEGGA